jgi:hypothetical protein
MARWAVLCPMVGQRGARPFRKAIKYMFRYSYVRAEQELFPKGDML